VSVLNVLLAHQSADVVDGYVRYLHALAPDVRFAVAHGGSREDFAAVRHEEKVFVDDPTPSVTW